MNQVGKRTESLFAYQRVGSFFNSPSMGAILTAKVRNEAGERITQKKFTDRTVRQDVAMGEKEKETTTKATENKLQIAFDAVEEKIFENSKALAFKLERQGLF